MKSRLILLTCVLIYNNGFAQNKQDNSIYGITYAKEFSKEIAEYSAKTFIMNAILDKTEHVLEFEVDALAAAALGQLTTFSPLGIE